MRIFIRSYQNTLGYRRKISTTFAVVGGASYYGYNDGIFLSVISTEVSRSHWDIGAMKSPLLLVMVVDQTTVLWPAFSAAICMLVFQLSTGVSALSNAPHLQ